MQEQEIVQMQTALEVKIIQTQETTRQIQIITTTVAIVDHHQTVIMVAEVDDRLAVEVTAEVAEVEDHLEEAEGDLFFY